MLDLKLDVNGQSQDARAEATTTLLDVLRDQLRLTGAKRGCNYGVCGVCTVLIDGKPGRACLTLAADCETRSILTIEGISPAGKLSTLQQAMLDAGAVQCGFCTPAIVLTATALLKDNPHPEEAEIRTGLGGNICRCTGYSAIVQAVLSVSHG